MSLLVFGQTGQVARALRAQAPGALPLGRAAADLARPESCAEAILAARPRAVINAAAYTAVDRAEEQETLATTVNGAAPGAMARACARLEIPLVHISTDYVFDGSGSAAWTPGARPAPLNAYGRSKLAGEQAIAASGCAHVILRTSWVFSAHGRNFVTTMLCLSETHQKLNIVEDQIGGPTAAARIASTCLTLAEALGDGQAGGIYHYSGAPSTSWKCFACETFARAGRAVVVCGIATAAYPSPARRPLNSRLDCSSLEADFGIAQPDWRADLADTIKEVLA